MTLAMSPGPSPALSAALTELDLLACPLEGLQLIEASAGTGKTWNICGLYLRLLLERGLTVQQILVVTFTNAATAELRERVRARLATALAAVRGEVRGEVRNDEPNDAPANERDGAVAAPAPADAFVARLLPHLHALGHGVQAIRAQLELALHTFDEAAIFTIHGFCQRALADAPFSAGLPLKMDLVQDDRDALHEAVNDFWRRRVVGGAGAPGLDADLAAWLYDSGDSPERWAALLQRHRAKPLARSIWPRGIDAPPAVNLDRVRQAFGAAGQVWQAQRSAILSLLDAASVSDLNKARYKPQSLADAAAEWDALFARADPLAPADVEGSKLTLLREATLRKGTKKGGTTPQHPFFALADAWCEACAASATALDLARLKLLREMLDEGSQALHAGKQARRVLSFDDLLFQLHRRLVPDGGPPGSPGSTARLASTLRARFPAALIDEFQDTDPLQFGIFEAIYGANRGGREGAAPLFLVGDPKQAIYSFRQADLPTYLRAQQQATARYSLAQNQRSTAGLIGALNALFQDHPHAFMQPGLDYVPVGFGAKPRPHFEDSSAPPGSAPADLQLWRLPMVGGEPIERAQAMHAAVQATAAEIARLLSQAQAGRVLQDGAPLRAGDIAVLVRSHAQGSRVRRALAGLGLASVELSQVSVFASREAAEIECVLRAVLEPSRAGLLRAALATELIGYDAAALAAMNADAADTPQAERIAQAELTARMQQFSAHRDTWLRRGVGTLLRQMLSDERVPQRLLPRPEGERRMTNLLHLIECLHAASETHAAPDDLLRWLQAQQREGAVDDVTQLRLESDQNLVQIVTVHKAKGLEYAIVFCPFLWDGHQRSGPAGAALEGLEYHASASQCAPGSAADLPADVRPGDTLIDYRAPWLPDTEKADIAEARRIEDAAESLRLAYVALTRAVQRCYLVVGGYRSRHGANFSTRQSTRSLLNWLVAGAGMTPQDWFGNDLTVPQIDAAWDRLVAQATEPAGSFAAADPARPAASIAIAPLPMQAGRPVRLPQPAPEMLAALPPPAHVPEGWRIGSYSGLAFGARHDNAAADHDARAAAFPLEAPADAPPRRPSAAYPAPDDDILHFPRGPAAGDCIHAVFEQAAFDDPSGWPQAIGRALADHPLHGAKQDSASMLARLLADVTATELQPGLKLAGLAPERLRKELEFHLPARGLAAGDLNEALHAAGYAVPRLAFGRLDGYLNGYIDLCFEHQGRHFLLDWKSNHLGPQPGDYAALPLEAAMAEHAYHLQALLYTVALHRLLKARRAGYDYGTHFGGVFYLFVRGVRPGWKGTDGSPLGVHFDRPEAATIEVLEALLDGRYSPPPSAGRTPR